MSAAYCSVREMEGCRSRKSVQTRGRKLNAMVAQVSGISCLWLMHTYDPGAGLRLRDSSGSGGGHRSASRHGCVAVSPSGFRGNAWVCEFQSVHDGVNACVVPTSGLGGAASFSVFKLWVHERNRMFGTDQKPVQALLPGLFCTVAMWSCGVKDTSRTCVHVVEPLVGDMRVTQIFNPCFNLLPHCTFGEAECSSSAPESGPVRQP